MTRFTTLLLRLTVLDDHDRIMGLLKPITELIRIAKEHNTTLFIDPATQAVYTPLMIVNTCFLLI